MKKQDTIKLNKASFSSRKDSRPNVTLDSIPKNKYGTKGLTITCCNGAEVSIWELENGMVEIGINDHNVKEKDLVSLDVYKGSTITEGINPFYVKSLKASSKTTKVDFSTFEK